MHEYNKIIIIHFIYIKKNKNHKFKIEFIFYQLHYSTLCK